MCWNAPEDFQSYPPVRVSVRNCLLSKEEVSTADALQCSRVIRNDPELVTNLAQTGRTPFDYRVLALRRVSLIAPSTSWRMASGTAGPGPSRLWPGSRVEYGVVGRALVSRAQAR
jgi:hypothetical protein